MYEIFCIFTEVCSYGSIRQQVSIGPGNGLAPDTGEKPSSEPMLTQFTDTYKYMQYKGSFAHCVFCCGQIVLTFWSRARQWYCRTVCKISKRLHNWNGCHRRIEYYAIEFEDVFQMYSVIRHWRFLESKWKMTKFCWGHQVSYTKEIILLVVSEFTIKSKHELFLSALISKLWIPVEIVKTCQGHCDDMWISCLELSDTILITWNDICQHSINVLLKTSGYVIIVAIIYAIMPLAYTQTYTCTHRQSVLQMRFNHGGATVLSSSNLGSFKLEVELFYVI